MAVLTDRAMRELSERLPAKPLARSIYGPGFEHEDRGAGSSVKRGTPQNPHPGDGTTVETYDVDGGGTVKATNGTTVAAETTNSYWLFLINGKWQSFPAQLSLCNPDDPTVVT